MTPVTDNPRTSDGVPFNADHSPISLRKCLELFLKAQNAIAEQTSQKQVLRPSISASLPSKNESRRPSLCGTINSSN